MYDNLSNIEDAFRTGDYYAVPRGCAYMHPAEDALHTAGPRDRTQQIFRVASNRGKRE